MKCVTDSSVMVKCLIAEEYSDKAPDAPPLMAPIGPH
jgi:hypothetical protein